MKAAASGPFAATQIGDGSHNGQALSETICRAAGRLIVVLPQLSRQEFAVKGWARSKGSLDHDEIVKLPASSPSHTPPVARLRYLTNISSTSLTPY